MAIEFDYQKHINNANPVREADSGQRREYLFLTFFAALFVLGLFFYGWQIYRFTDNGYQIQAAQKKKQQLLEFKQQLTLESASLKSPERIDSFARERLGMVRAAPGQIVTLSPEAPLTIPGVQASNQPELSAKK
jgi:cell division protein FtsL